MKCILTAFILIILVHGLETVHGTEIDDTTSYYDLIEDSEAQLNADVQQFIDLTRATYRGCNLNIFSKKVAYYLTGNLFYGSIEAGANRSVKISKQSLAVPQSIYAKTPYERSLVGRFFGLGSTININGHHIGTDKLGHFFDMGYSLLALYKEEKSITTLVMKSKSEQQGIWGMMATGVKSYGDIAANFDGYRFWSAMAGRSKNPYFVCEKGSLKQVRAFRWSEYVNAAWTEATNCSVYSEPAYAVAIASNVERLEKQSGKRFTCPVVPENCEKIRSHYAQWLKPAQLNEVISPSCGSN